uniref:DNA2/NAM7 helicase-like C-terminal domain-containing protein n=1 Tax=Panagrolaimus superbus TaxID=310955 RepID=A0A914Z1C3_9BILA
MKMENEYYLDFLLNEKSARSTIMEAFMPDSESNERIYQIPNKDREARKDKKIKAGDSTFAQFIARNEINAGKPIVIIDGPPQTGKTDLLSYIVPDILKSLITSSSSDSDKCFALVSPAYTLRNLVIKIKQHSKYQQICHKIKILDLTVWPADECGSFLSVIQVTLKRSIGDYDAQEKLRKAHTAFCSKVQPQNLEIYDSFDSTDTDLITSKELKVFQDAIKVIFAYYHPNFVIASNETFISLLPSMANYISHIAIDEAGKASYLDCFAMVLEAPHLQQLILIGDTNQYPTHRRIKQSQLPDCFKNVMFEVNWKSPALTYIQLNKTFYMNPGTVEIINKLFCPERILTPLYPTTLTKSPLIRNPELGIAFYDTDGWDAHVKPTSRKNFGHHFQALQIIYQLLDLYPGQKITVLCYYVAQKLMMEKTLRCEMIDQRVEVSTVDGYFGKNSDICIIITTRTLDAVKFLRHYTRLVKHSRVFFRKLPMQHNIELGKDVGEFLSFLTVIIKY